MDTQKVKTWSGKLLRHFLVFLLATGVAILVVYKIFFMPLQKNIQNADKIINTEVYIDDEKVVIGKFPFLFGSKIKLLSIEKREKVNKKEAK